MLAAEALGARAPLPGARRVPRIPARGATARPARRVWLCEGTFAFAIALVVPLLLCMAGLGPSLRVLSPAITTCAAGVLFFRRSPWYVGLCVWSFCSTPLIRRLIDAQAGWDPSNPALLSPYLACAFAGLTAVHLMAKAPRGPRHAAPFLLMLVCVAYGLVLAVLGDRTLSGLVDAMKWSAGPLVALHVLHNGEMRLAYRKVLAASLLFAVPLMSAYGIAQYVNPMPWDVEWMENAKSLGLDSIGTPQPFDVRVFATMNSPGSFGALLAFGILIAFQSRLLVMLPVTILGAVALMLTQYRSVWMATLIGVAYIVMLGSRRSYGRMVGVFAVVAIALGLTALAPQMQDNIVERFQTLGTLSADESGEDRLHQYVSFFSSGSGSSSDAIVGEGLASFGAFRSLDKKATTVTDSGIIEIFSVYGIVFGTIFLLCLGAIVAVVFSSVRKPETDLYRGATIAFLCLIPFGSIFVGETGFCAWLLLGLAVAFANASAPSAPQPVERDVHEIFTAP